MNVIELAKAHKWNMPTHCPLCNSPIEISDNHRQMWCSNQSCKSYLKGRIGRWTATVGAKGFGFAVIEDLVNSCDVSGIADLYNKNTYIKLLKLDGYGERTTDKLYSEITKTKELTLPKFISGFAIDGLGETQLTKIITEHCYQNIEQMCAAGSNGFVSKGIGPATALKLMRGFIQLKEDMDNVLRFISIKAAEKKVEGGKLAGMTFCFTGKACMPRPQLAKIVTDNGGEAWGGVKKGLSFLVTDDTESGSAKNVAAKKLGIPVISSTEFLEMVK